MTKTVLETFLESFEGIQDPEVVMALLSEDCEFRAPGGVALRGAAHIREYLGAIHSAVPEVTHEVSNTVVSGDMTVIELTSSGVHKGTFEMDGFGQVAPSERRISTDGAVVMRIKGQKITSFHMYFDRMSLAEQMSPAGSGVTAPTGGS